MLSSRPQSPRATVPPALYALLPTKKCFSRSFDFGREFLAGTHDRCTTRDVLMSPNARVLVTCPTRFAARLTVLREVRPLPPCRPPVAERARVRLDANLAWKQASIGAHPAVEVIVWDFLIGPWWLVTFRLGFRETVPRAGCLRKIKIIIPGEFDDRRRIRRYTFAKLHPASRNDRHHNDARLTPLQLVTKKRVRRCGVRASSLRVSRVSSPSDLPRANQSHPCASANA